MPQPQQIVHNWVLEQQIGSGSFATVWRARHLTSGVLAALKAIDLTRLNSKLQQSLASEISVLERTSHPNIVGLLELLKVSNKGFHMRWCTAIQFVACTIIASCVCYLLHLQEPGKVYLVLEYW
jgi:serine/threonine protein kinase